MSKTELYGNLHLLGYKINEFSNWDFLAQRPDKTEVVFSKEGEIIQGNLEETMQISKDIYTAIQNNKLIMFNRQGDIIDETNRVDELDDYLYTLSQKHHHIMFPQSDSNDTLVNVYTIDGKQKFKDIEPWKILNLVYQDGKSKLVCEGNEYNQDKIHLIGTEGNIEDIQFVGKKCKGVNNHYILTQEDEMYYLVDFKGQEIYRGKDTILIDKINLDNDTIIRINDNTVKITSKLLNLSLEYKTKNYLRQVEFTTNKDILIIREAGDVYLLNIRTLKRTPTDFYVAHSIGNIVYSIINDDDFSRIGKFNSDTLEIDERLKSQYYGYNREYVVFGTGTTETYYTLDLEPLINEF